MELKGGGDGQGHGLQSGGCWLGEGRPVLKGNSLKLRGEKMAATPCGCFRGLMKGGDEGRQRALPTCCPQPRAQSGALQQPCSFRPQSLSLPANPRHCGVSSINHFMFETNPLGWKSLYFETLRFDHFLEGVSVWRGEEWGRPV